MSFKWLAAPLLVTIATVASAQSFEPAPLPSEEPALAILNQGGAATSDIELLGRLDRALATLLQPTPFRGTILCARGAVLARLNRPDEARAAFDQCRQLRPDDPQVLMAIAFDEVRRQRPTEAARLVRRAVALDPHAADHIDPSMMDTIVRQLRYTGQDGMADDLLATLATTGYARLNPDAASDLAFQAVLRRIDQGDREGARRMLPSVIAPEPGLKMLIDRQFEAIWPSADAWAGGDLSVQRKALLDGARATYDATPTPASRVAYAVALVDTGHRQEGIALLDGWLSGPEADGRDPWYRNMAAVKLGRWLGEAGRRTEGIERMQRAYASADGRDASGSNIVPNLVIQQLLAHDYAGATATLDGHTPAPDELETPAASGYFVALHACADEGAGRHDDALVKAKRVQTVYASVEGAVELALACVGRPEEQAAHWLARIRDPSKRSAALLDMARARYRKQHDLPLNAIDDAMMRTLWDRGDVREAYVRYGRDLPSGYLPALDDFNEPVFAKPPSSGVN